MTDDERLVAAENALSLVDVFDRIEEIAQVTIPDAVDLIENDVPALIQLLHDVRRAQSALKLADEFVSGALVKRIPYGVSEVSGVPGVGTVEVKGGSKRKGFDQRLLISAYAKRLGLEASAEILGTTEPPEQLRLAIEFAVVKMAEATGATAPSFTSWRSGVAKQLGLDLNDYAADREPSPKTVILR